MAVDERVSQLEGRFSVLIRLTEELKEEVKALRSELSNQISDLRDTVQKLETKLTAHEKSFATKEHLHRLEIKVAEMEGKYNNLRTMLEDHKKENDARFRLIEDELGELSDRIAEFNDMLSRANSQLSSIDTALKERYALEKMTVAKIALISSVIGTLISLISFFLLHSH